jgi:hypothetical protein
MEITGFDEQIGVVRKGVKAIKRADAFINKKTRLNVSKPQPKPTRVIIRKAGQPTVIKTRPVATTRAIAPTRVVTTTRAVAPVKRGGVFNKLKASQVRVAPTRVVTPTRVVAPSRSVFVKPTQPSRIVTAKQFRKLKSAPVARPTMVTRPSAPALRPTMVTRPSAPASRPIMVTRPSAPVKVFSTDGTLRNVSPSTFKQMSDVKRSFARVDLPFQPVTPPTKFVRIKNSPINLPVNINMIEPAVDSGVKDYYGK